MKVHVDGRADHHAPPRATARSTRWTTRCARRWSAATRSWPRSSLADYKVRILGWKGGTSATTRVLIDTTDGVGEWTTVGVHDNIVEASWHALVDALDLRRPAPAGDRLSRGQPRAEISPIGPQPEHVGRDPT